jgi:hypothetical protein
MPSHLSALAARYAGPIIDAVRKEYRSAEADDEQVTRWADAAAPLANRYRAPAFRVLAGHLGGRSERARQDHLAAALPSVIGGDWMAEHWLAAHAILALT